MGMIVLFRQIDFDGQLFNEFFFVFLDEIGLFFLLDFIDFFLLVISEIAVEVFAFKFVVCFVGLGVCFGVEGKEMSIEMVIGCEGDKFQSIAIWCFVCMPGVDLFFILFGKLRMWGIVCHFIYITKLKLELIVYDCISRLIVIRVNGN